LPWPDLSPFHNYRRIGLVLLRHQPHAVNPLAVFLDELAALVLLDGYPPIPSRWPSPHEGKTYSLPFSVTLRIF
jgi:hypothetical protein